MAEHDPSIDGEGFSVDAERERRAGRLDEARRLAVAGLAEEPGSLAGRLVLALTLLDLGEAQAARYELIRAVEGLPAHAVLGEAFEDYESTQDGDGGVEDEEFEAAFEQAEAVPDEMQNVNDVAEAVLRDESLVEPEDFDPLAEPAFATETMAALLEHQGDRGAAAAIRTSLRGPGAAAGARPAVDGVEGADAVETGERARLIATLEGWLANLRGASR